MATNESFVTPKRPSVAANVVANWTWYVLVVASGFVLPRLIAQYQGKSLLGVWDLGWSLLFYVSLLKMSAGAAVSRYVSRYRELQDWPSLNSTLNASLTFLSASAAIGLLPACILASHMEYLLRDASPEILRTAGWVIALLGASAALEMPIGVFNAVLTGYERFDLLNWARGTRDVAVFAAMVVMLCAGLGIASLAGAVLAGTLGFGVAQVIMAKRLCPQIQVSPRWCSWRAFRKVAVFGSKSMSRDISRALLYQLNGVLVGMFLGPAALAVYTRQRNLVMQVFKLIKQFAQVFIPVSSGLDARNDIRSLQRLLIASAQSGMYIALPMILVLIFLGRPLVRLWMGEGFEAPVVLAILAAGHLLSVAQLGPYAVLEGMGRHGRPAVLELTGALFGVGLTWLGLAMFGWTMEGAAMAVAIAVCISTGVLMPCYACRVVDLPIRQYIKEVFPMPIVAVLPLAMGLWKAQELLRIDAFGLGAAALALGAVVSLGFYWLWFVPPAMKARIREYIQSVGRLRAGGRARVS